MPETLINLVRVTKHYRREAIDIPVLDNIDLEISRGEFLALMGPSGSGKTTLLHLLGTLDRPDQGSIHLEGQRIDHLPSERRDALRNGTFGFIFQFYHLLPELSTLDNVLMPQMIAHSVLGWLSRRKEIRRRGLELLKKVGLSHRLKHRPSELSGGEMQRAAIARALINRPRVLLADEPTGNLDSSTGQEIFGLLRDLNRHEGLTIIMVTHNLELAGDTDRMVRLVAGRVERATTEICDY